METSKKAQALRRQEIQHCTEELESRSSSVEDLFLELRKIANYGTDDDAIELTSEKIKRFELELSEIKDLTARLKSLEPTNSLLRHYETKIATREEKFEELRPTLENRISQDENEDASLQKETIIDTKIEQIAFISPDPVELTRQLLELSDLIDSRFKILTPDVLKFLRARQKFEKGIKMLVLSDSQNKMLPLFEEKQLEWNKKYKLNLYILIGLAVAPFLIMLIGVIAENM